MGLEPTPAFSASTLSDGGGVRPGQTASTVHVHPSGQFVYVGNRGAPAGGRNEIAVFRINETTGEPSPSRMSTHAASHRGRRARPFRPSARRREPEFGVRQRGGSTKLVPANLAVFRVGSNGTLTFVQRYDVAVARKPLWWMGIVASR